VFNADCLLRVIIVVCRYLLVDGLLFAVLLFVCWLPVICGRCCLLPFYVGVLRLLYVLTVGIYRCILFRDAVHLLSVWWLLRIDTNFLGRLLTFAVFCLLLCIYWLLPFICVTCLGVLPLGLIPVIICCLLFVIVVVCRCC